MPVEVRALLRRLRVRFLHRNVYLLVPLFLLTLLLFLACSPLEYYRTTPLAYSDTVENSRTLLRQVSFTPPTIDTTTGRTRLRSPHKNFTIHVWRHGPRMERRFLRSYGRAERDPYAHCSVRNCHLSVDDSLVERSDAVLFHLHQTKGPETLPLRRPPHQQWIFFTDESPLHTFLLTKKFEMKDYDGLFNWSMTYRSDSDVPVPYGRTVLLSPSEKSNYVAKDFAKSKNRGIAILGSNCGGQNRRWEYVKELQRYVDVDVYGGCGTHTCPGHFTRDCPVIANYKFYLAFENSNCREYITEKLWWNAYAKETVPVVMGAPKSDYERLCPPNSFLHVEDFASPKALAHRLQTLMSDDNEYNALFRWKSDYKVVNEHGYFGSPSLHLCRICEALNRQSAHSEPKTYNDLKSFWNPETDCYKAAWAPNKRESKIRTARSIHKPNLLEQTLRTQNRFLNNSSNVMKKLKLFTRTL